MRVSVLWNSSVFSSRGPRLLETLNNKNLLSLALLLSPFASALLEEVKKNIKIH
jgi:hypothetical protein